jgi:hypothetical protein
VEGNLDIVIFKILKMLNSPDSLFVSLLCSP